MDLRVAACSALGIALLAACTGCAGVIGLDPGISDDAGSGADGGDANERADSGVDDATHPADSATLDGAADAPHADVTSAGDSAGASDGCVSTQSDPLNCGTCAHACPYGANSHATCTAGVCGLACMGGALDCDQQPADGCECTTVPNGQASCGAGGSCGHVCNQGYVDCAGKPCSCGGGQLCLSDGTCGACRTLGQPCQLGKDCCSGTCGAGLTCL